MDDNAFGTPEERDAALKVCEATKALNSAIWEAHHIGVNVKIIDIREEWDDPTELQIQRMERRVKILPSALPPF